MLAHKQTVGKLDRKITLQKRIIGVNESNEDAEIGWENITVNPVVWAKIEDGTGNEAYRADGLTAYVPSKITIRYRADVTPLMRALYRDRKYDILSISEESRDRYLVLNCESGMTYQESGS